MSARERINPGDAIARFDTRIGFGLDFGEIVTSRSIGAGFRNVCAGGIQHCQGVSAGVAINRALFGRGIPIGLGQCVGVRSVAPGLHGGLGVEIGFGMRGCAGDVIARPQPFECPSRDIKTSPDFPQPETADAPRCQKP